MNLTGSVLSYNPKIEDQGKFLSCRAENPQIPDSGVEKGFTLNLHRKFLVPIIPQFKTLRHIGMSESRFPFLEAIRKTFFSIPTQILPLLRSSLAQTIRL